MRSFIETVDHADSLNHDRHLKIDSNYFKIRLFAFEKKTVGRWWDFKGHISPFARIFLLEDGEQKVTFHGTTYHQKENHIALVPPYTPVDYHCPNSAIQYYFIFTCQLPNGKDIFADHQFPYLLESEPWQMDMCEKLLEKLPDYGLSNVDADTDDFNQQIFQSTIQEVTLEQKLAGQGLVGMLFSLFAAKATENEDSIRFVKTFQYIEKHLDSDLSLSGLAKLEGLSLSYFSDQFYLYTGIRPSEYIGQKRENRARELLTTTNLSLQEVAHHVGFSDVSYFYRFFKKRTGETAKAYRENSSPAEKDPDASE